MTMDWAQLPGGTRLMRGVADLWAGVESADALLVRIAHGRLRTAGLDLPPLEARAGADEERLYLALVDSEEDPYGAYNARLRELSSFARALEALGQSAGARGDGVVVSPCEPVTAAQRGDSP